MENNNNLTNSILEINKIIISRSSNIKNDFYSPISILIILHLLKTGLKGESKLNIENSLKLYNISELNIKNILSSFNYSNNFITLKLINGIFIRNENIKKEYIEIGKNNYNAMISNLDLTKINNFVKEGTNGKIDKIFDSLEPETVIAMVNIIYFKSQWMNEFEYEIKKDFFNFSENKVSIDFLHTDGMYIHCLKSGKDIHIAIPYKEEGTYLYINMPGMFDGMLKNVNLEMFKKCLSNKLTKYKLQIPKLLLKNEYNLLDIFSQLNLDKLPYKDFDDIIVEAERSEPEISKFVHKSFLEVNLEGTEAAGVAGITIKNRCMIIQENELIEIDRPFYLSIIKDYIILFTGKIVRLS